MHIVPSPSLELISIDIFNLSHNFLHKYKPIPVDFLPDTLPFIPVKPLSNTRDISLSLIPITLSLIYKTMQSFLFLLYTSILGIMLLFLYFILF